MSGRYRGAGAARAVMLVVDVLAGVLGLWIALSLLGANPSNDLAHTVHEVADWLSTWARDLFAPSQSWLRTLLNYGIPALAYLLVGLVVAGWLRRVD
ncbi:hypothetical protein [Kitasatospora paracochleata]|uniref:Quinol-cytochrome oxidoreductase complex cytochrome b subunit n=1 Tax=Kitasatospora paracochleata TaxID=58354 RepID=A0ABT1J4Z2_9ACTN|nr:hypothetical protein [Kitasatospora paracochleata]MCP2311816.1 quinol-cytochrome oxidoreductase complex cytochrome b subunit [Kitasatospora paracochleata]